MPETAKHPPSTAPGAPDRERAGMPWGSVLRNLALVLTVLVVVWLVLHVKLPSVGTLQAEIAELGAWGPLLFIALYEVVAETPRPVTMVALAGAMSFDLPVGAARSLLGGVIGCYGGYGLAPVLGRETVMRLLGSHAEVVEEHVGDGGFYA